MNLNDMAMWQWFAIAGVGVLLISVIVYFLPVGKMKLPLVVTASFGGIVAGLAVGILLMAAFGYRLKEEVPSSDSSGGGGVPAPKVAGPGAPGGLSKGPPGKGPGGPGKGPGGPGKGNSGGPPQPPSPRTQLANLVAALDAVADRPVTLTLTPDQKTAIVEQLKGLDQADEITDEDAKKRLDAIVKVVEKDQKTLETVGFRSTPPGKSGSGAPKEDPNPFKEGRAAEQLKSLLGRLTKT